MRLQPDRLDAHVRPAPAGELVQPLAHVGLRIVDHLGPAPGMSELEALRYAVDGDNPLRAQQPRALHRELPDRPTPPHRNGVAGLHVAALDRLIARREDVGQEQDLLVGERVGHLERADVGERDPHVLGLPARIPAHQVRVAKNPARRVPEHGLGEGGFGVRVVA